MSYRCVIVSNPAHISTRSEQLVVETDERHTVPIEDISALMLESRRATLSACKTVPQRPFCRRRQSGAAAP